MRKSLAALCLVSLLLVVLTSSTAMGRTNEPTAEFTIQLDDVREDDARADLLNLFIRERDNQLQIIVTLVNRKVSRGRAAASFYYMENLRVRPGDTIKIVPQGGARPYEARIEAIEARFPPGKPPQFQIIAANEPEKNRSQSRPFPRLAAEGFQGQRTLDKTKSEDGKQKPDLITCSGDTPGDLRIRLGTLVDVENVGLAFSTVYRIDDAQHTWNANNGLQTRYRGARYLSGRKAER